jgi:hypothetical protein
MPEYKLLTGTKVLLFLTGLTMFALIVSIISVEASGGKVSLFDQILFVLMFFWATATIFHNAGAESAWKKAHK